MNANPKSMMARYYALNAALCLLLWLMTGVVLAQETMGQLQVEVFGVDLNGRMALVVEIEAGGATLVIYNVHLERRDSESLRLLQLEEIVADAKRYQPGTPLILAGDFNTSSHDSPVIKRLGEAGFRNALERETEATNLKGASLDWIFVRGPILGGETL